MRYTVDAKGWLYLKPHRKKVPFQVQEFVPRKTYNQFGPEICYLWYMSREMVDVAVDIRRHFGKSMRINDWHYRKNGFNLRGYRPVRTTIGSVHSQHGLCRAIDFNIDGMKTIDVWNEIVGNMGVFAEYGVTSIEDKALTIKPGKTGWIHVDWRPWGDIRKDETIKIIGL